MQWLARLPGTQEIHGSSPGRGMTDFCTSIFICLYIYTCTSIKVFEYLSGIWSRMFGVGLGLVATVSVYVTGDGIKSSIWDLIPQ